MNSITRRQFLQSTSALGVACAIPSRSTAADATLADLDVRIQRAIACEVHYERPRIVAGNSGYRLAGSQRRDWTLLLFGNNGKIGVGACQVGAKEPDGRFLLGKPLGELLTQRVDEVNRRTTTSALWDLAGKSLGKPVYELLGGTMPEKGIPVYDGSIYHEELLNRDGGSAYRNPNAKYTRRPNWDDIIREAIDSTLAIGHNFVKVKIGRGHKHLSREAGNLQDVAVLTLIRDYGGDNFGIGVDANNGYRLEDTQWLLKEHGDLKLAFIEEMFPDNVDQYRAVRETLSELKLKTMIADGESWKGPADPLAKEMIDSGVVQILQGDMRRFRIEGILQESRMAIESGHGSLIAPHNWGSEFGFHMQLHVGCAIPNFYRAEHDPGTIKNDVLIKHGYDIKDGYCTNFDSPGLGTELNVDKLGEIKPIFDVGK